MASAGGVLMGWKLPLRAARIGNLGNVDEDTGTPLADPNFVLGSADGTVWQPATVSGTGSTPADSTTTVLDGMLATWWNDPNRAQTFRGNIYTGGVDAGGEIVVESTSDDDDRFVLGDFEQDDHNGVTLLIEPDHGPLVFYQRHGLDSVLRYRRGTVPGDLTSLGSEQTLTTSAVCTYAQVWRKPGTDTIWVVTRAGVYNSNPVWQFWRSDDFGATWGPRTNLLGPEDYVYMASVQVGSTVRVAVAKHPQASSRDVWWCEVDLETGAIVRRDGTALGNLDGTNLPLTTADLPTVYTAPSGHGLRLLANSDRADADGGPALGVATWTSDADTVYRHVDYDGGAWTATTVVAAGVVVGFTPSVHYNGGVAFPDRTLGGELLVSREASGTWYLERWEQRGTSWVTVETYETSTDRLFRPWPSRGGGFVYCRAATYPNFTSYTDPTIVAVLTGVTAVQLGDTVVAETQFGLEPDAGTSNLASRADHTHGSPDDPDVGGANETVFAPDYTVTDGDNLQVALDVVWGVDTDGDPYYNAAGVTAGDEAVLVLDNDTGALSLRPVEIT
jgi:hypothetical protein